MLWMLLDVSYRSDSAELKKEQSLNNLCVSVSLNAGCSSVSCRRTEGRSSVNVFNRMKYGRIQHAGSARYLEVFDLQHCSKLPFLWLSSCMPRRPPSVAYSLHISLSSAHQRMAHYSSLVCVCMRMIMSAYCMCVCKRSCCHPTAPIFKQVKTKI